MTVRMHRTGVYRLSNGGDRFGQVRRVGREWHAEIRETETGTLVRFAGIWRTRRDAVEEIQHVLSR